jgi:hypothetical protein
MKKDLKKEEIKKDEIVILCLLIHGKPHYFVGYCNGL